jgi:RNA polymerase sigma factor (sigma-70 family)
VSFRRDAVSPQPSAHANAVAAVYDACHAPLYGYLASLTHDPGVAEEFVQEAFVRLVAASRRGAMPDDPRAWLYAVSTNLVIGRSRRRAIVGRWIHRLRPLEHDQVVEAPEETALRRERHDDLSNALASLPADARAALLLAAEGFSGREIARAIGKSDGATRSLLWRSRLALRVRLEHGAMR